jgi:hypothetical protein
LSEAVNVAHSADMKAVQALIEFAQTEKGEGILSS